MTSNGQSRHFPSGEVSRPGNQPKASKTLLDISHRLRPRDFVIAALLHEHTTLTTEHLTAILFTSPVTARHRLNKLRRNGFVDGFIRNRPGEPNAACWVPGHLSARLMALAEGGNPPSIRAVGERKDRIYTNPAIEHLLGTNSFFIELMAHARANPDCRLLRWWSERTTAGAFGQRIHPDGHGVWSHNGHETGFFFEYDRGTETIGKLADKLISHRRLRAEGGPSYPILFSLHSKDREQHLHRRLAEREEPHLVVATTSRELPGSPAEAMWRVAGYGGARLRLADLPSGHGQSGPLNPGPPVPSDDPLDPLR